MEMMDSNGSAMVIWRQYRGNVKEIQGKMKEAMANNRVKEMKKIRKILRKHKGSIKENEWLTKGL